VEVKTIPAIPISRLDRKIDWDDTEGESSQDKNVEDSENYIRSTLYHRTVF
jgi:hypothetical protein